eukprot:3970823-Alexandrium_andersonii.AAC.1
MLPIAPQMLGFAGDFLFGTVAPSGLDHAWSTCCAKGRFEQVGVSERRPMCACASHQLAPRE